MGTRPRVGIKAALIYGVLPSTRSRVVLVVEDDPQAREFFATALRAGGFRVVVRAVRGLRESSARAAPAFNPNGPSAPLP